MTNNAAHLESIELDVGIAVNEPFGQSSDGVSGSAYWVSAFAMRK